MSSVVTKYDLIWSFFKVLILLQTALQNRKQVAICVYNGHNTFDWDPFIIRDHILLFLLMVSCFCSSHKVYLYEPGMRGDAHSKEALI